MAVTQTLPLLIVDDDALILAALQETLKREGYTVTTAKDGAAALEIIKFQHFALIICDQRMPDILGIEVLRQAQAIQPDAVRVLLTGHGDLNMALEAINVGQVSQFITKPWDDAQLKQTVITALNKYRLIKENQNLHELILEQHQTLAKTHEQLRYDLQVGAHIHETMLLGKIPTQIPGFAIEAFTVPSKEIDGDFFEFYHPTPTILDVVIGDVMGKGIPAALVGTALKTQLLRFAVPLTHIQKYDKQEFWVDDLLKPEEILTHVHAELIPQLIQLDYFVSLFYGRFDLTKQTFHFVDCGFTKPIHYQSKKQQAVPLVGNNYPLGVKEKTTYEALEVMYDVGDCFIFYSDGVTEAKTAENELFGYERLIHIAESNPEAEPKDLMQLIQKAAMDFAQKNYFDDDLTIIVIKIKEHSIPLGKKVAATSFLADLSQLNVMRDFINRLCQKAPGDALHFSSQLQLALNEAFCNIVKYGYSEQGKGIVRIQSEWTADGLMIELSDQGRAFDPTQVDEPNFAGNKESGFGWFLIKEIADNITYIRKESENGWNHLQLYKKFLLEGNEMQIQHATENNVLVITPQGKSLDAKDAPQFKENVLHLIESSHVSSVVFDLHELQFIDSSGLGSFLSVLRLLNSSGGELKLACMNKPIRMMFELVSMHKIFEIYNSTQDAVQSFKS